MAGDGNSSPWERLSALPVLIESYEFERRPATVAYGFERVTTAVRLLGGGAEGLGEDVSPYEGEDDTLHVLAPVLPLAGEWTLGSFCDRLAELDQWPVPPRWDMARRWRNWAFESAALDLALNQAGRALHEVVGREPRAGALRQLARARRAADVRPDPPPARAPPRTCASSSTSRRLDARADRRGRRHGRGRDRRLQGPLRPRAARAAGAPRACTSAPSAAFPDALLEDAHDLPEVTAAARARDPPHLLRRADPLGRVARRDAADAARREHQAVPRRRPAVAVRRLRRVRRARPDHVRRRDGRARTSAAPRSSCSPRCSTRTGRTTSRPSGYNLDTPAADLPTSPLAAEPSAAGFRLK